MTDNPLLGTWRLISYEIESPDGTVSRPYGARPRGYLVYTADGYLALAIMAEARAAYAVPDRLLASTAEKAAAAETYQSYAGRYTVEAERVIHHIEVSLIPNWAGGDQVRYYRLEGTRLTLRTPPMAVGGAGRTGRVVWERA